MKSIVNTLPLLGLCCLSPFVANAGGEIGWRKIDNIVQRECVPSKGLQITFTTSHNNPDVCTNSTTVEVSCDLSTYKQILAMALTAQSANMDVNGYVGTCDAEGQANLKTIKIR